MDPGVTLGLLAATFTASFVEFVEALTIVLAMGTTRGWRSALSGVVAAAGAAAAGVAVVGLGAAAHRPLARVPENTLKYAVGLMLASFGTFWSVEGLGVFQSGGDSLGWPGDNWSLLGVLAAW